MNKIIYIIIPVLFVIAAVVLASFLTGEVVEEIPLPTPQAEETPLPTEIEVVVEETPLPSETVEETPLPTETYRRYTSGGSSSSPDPTPTEIPELLPEHPTIFMTLIGMIIVLGLIFKRKE